MKLTTILSATMLTLSVAFTACSGTPELPPGPGITEEEGGGGTTNMGDGTEGNPYLVADAIANQTGSGYVKGYIVGWFNNKPKPGVCEFGNTNTADTTVNKANILIAAVPTETSPSKIICVQLPAGVLRNALNLGDNPTNLGKEVLIYGTLTAYNSLPGIRPATYAFFEGTAYGTKPIETTLGDGTEGNPYHVSDAIANQTGSAYVKGYIVGWFNNKPNPGVCEFGNTNTADTTVNKANILIAAVPTETSPSKVICVQLPAGVLRNALNLGDKPTNLGKEVLIYGTLTAHNSLPGIRPAVYAFFEGTAYGTKPIDTTGALLFETLLTTESYSKFTAVSVIGAQEWRHDTRFGALCSGFANGASYQNEDWFISPEVNLSEKKSATLSFEHARGPAGSITVGVAEGWYKVYATANYTGDVSTTAWVELTGVNHGTTAWAFVGSGNLAIPTSVLTSTMRFAFRYESSSSASATWEIKNVLLK